MKTISDMGNGSTRNWYVSSEGLYLPRQAFPGLSVHWWESSSINKIKKLIMRHNSDLSVSLCKSQGWVTWAGYSRWTSSSFVVTGILPALLVFTFPIVTLLDTQWSCSWWLIGAPGFKHSFLYFWFFWVTGSNVIIGPGWSRADKVLA